MGAHLCSLRQSSQEEPVVPKHNGPNDRPAYVRMSIIMLIKPSCLKIEEEKKKRQLHPQPQVKKITKIRKLSLEEYLSASPGIKKDYINGGELHVLRHTSRVHPSIITGVHEHMMISRPRESYKGDMVVSSVISGKQRGKLKKKRVKMVTKVRKLTLEDHILASPGMKKDHINGGELSAFGNTSRPRDSFSLERVAKVDEDDKEDLVISSSLSRMGSGKLKKKVSFRMPVEADIIIYHSPEEESRD